MRSAFGYGYGYMSQQMRTMDPRLLQPSMPSLADDACGFCTHGTMRAMRPEYRDLYKDMCSRQVGTNGADATQECTTTDTTPQPKPYSDKFAMASGAAGDTVRRFARAIFLLMLDELIRNKTAFQASSFELLREHIATLAPFLDATQARELRAMVVDGEYSVAIFIQRVLHKNIDPEKAARAAPVPLLTPFAWLAAIARLFHIMKRIEESVVGAAAKFLAAERTCAAPRQGRLSAAERCSAPCVMAGTTCTHSRHPLWERIKTNTSSVWWTSNALCGLHAMVSGIQARRPSPNPNVFKEREDYVTKGLTERGQAPVAVDRDSQWVQDTCHFCDVMRRRNLLPAGDFHEMCGARSCKPVLQLRRPIMPRATSVHDPECMFARGLFMELILEVNSKYDKNMPAARGMFGTVTFAGLRTAIALVERFLSRAELVQATSIVREAEKAAASHVKEVMHASTMDGAPLLVPEAWVAAMRRFLAFFTDCEHDVLVVLNKGIVADRTCAAPSKGACEAPCVLVTKKSFLGFKTSTACTHTKHPSAAERAAKSGGSWSRQGCGLLGLYTTT